MDCIILDYTSWVTQDFIANQTSVNPINNQVFTPIEIAQYMANMVQLPQGNISILDPGAGTGILTSALCDRIYNEIDSPIEINITVYENDEKILPYLKKSLNNCKFHLQEKNHSVNYNIQKSDFLIEGEKYFVPVNDKKYKKLKNHDIIIANPPYQKIKHSSTLIEPFSSVLFGQTNSYVLFIALSLKMLKERGSFTFLNPRSLFSGPYHKRIRNWMLENYCISHVHLFKSRKDIFESHDVKQELIIINGIKRDKPKCDPIIISLSESKNLKDVQPFSVPYETIVPKNSLEKNIHIPENDNDIKIIDLIHSWDSNLNDYGIFVSTGKIVDFRHSNFINIDPSGCEIVPLLWMQHIRKNQIKWPLPDFKKPQIIKKCKDSINKLVPKDNYVLLRRFSSKDEKSRIVSAPLFQHQFDMYNYLGFENHLNYLYKKDSSLSIEEVQGLSLFLNSIFVDRYYRSLCGSTQVNAIDLNNMKMPKQAEILKIGKLFSQITNNSANIDVKIGKILKIDSVLIKSILKSSPFK